MSFMILFHSFQLLSVIRDNSVIVVVGETGSGKTTQLTQVSTWLRRAELSVVINKTSSTELFYGVLHVCIKVLKLSSEGNFICDIPR